MQGDSQQKPDPEEAYLDPELGKGSPCFLGQGTHLLVWTQRWGGLEGVLTFPASPGPALTVHCGGGRRLCRSGDGRGD